MDITHKLLARVASASYFSSAAIRNLGFTSVSRVQCKLTGTICYIAKHVPTRQIVISFRGSDDVQDWKINLNIAKVHTTRMHKGFVTAYNSVRTRLLHEVRGCIGWTIYGTSHSLGGALINISASDHEIHYKELVTFGQPRVFGIKSKSDLGGTKLTRYVDVSDIVCLLPFYKYKHLGKPVFIKDGKIVPPMNRFKRWVEASKAWKWPRSHSISNYIIAL